MSDDTPHPKQLDRQTAKALVEHGYDRVAERHLAWALESRQEERQRYTQLLLDRMPAGADVLELGCGAGLPTTRLLAQRFTVTGVDISARQIDLARREVPHATFVQGDMTNLDLPAGSFDAVAAFYSLIHVPREEHAGMLARIVSWLRPGGVLVATMGARDNPGDIEEDWLGAPMYWSQWDAPTNQRLVTEAGLHVVSANEETAEEFGAPITFLWVVAEKDDVRMSAAP